MIACTSPAGTCSDTPLRIGLSATVAWRLVILSTWCRFLLKIVVHGLDVAAVGIEHERPVIARMIVRPGAGRSVVAPAALQRSGMESIDELPSSGGESDVYVALDRLAAPEPEIGS